MKTCDWKGENHTSILQRTFTLDRKKKKLLLIVLTPMYEVCDYNPLSYVYALKYKF